MNQLDSTQALPFRTQDAILALSLTNAGVPEWMPPTNTYDEDILFTAGGGKKDAAGKVTRRSRYAGLTLEQGVRQAITDGPRGKGHVEYWLERTKELPYFLKVYSEQGAEITAPGNDRDAGERLREIVARVAGRDPVTSDPCPPMDEREGLLRITAIVCKLRGAFVNRWKTQIPMLRIPMEGKVEKGAGLRGSTYETHPGFKLVPLNATEQTRKDLKL